MRNKRLVTWLIAIAPLSAAPLASGQIAPAIPASQASGSPPPASREFHVSAREGADGIAVRWVLAPGIELYRKSVKLSVNLRRGATRIRYRAKPDMPGSHWVKDVLGMRVRVFQGQASALVPEKNLPSGVPQSVTVEYRGCSTTWHICYLPQKQTFSLARPQSDGQ